MSELAALWSLGSDFPVRVLAVAGGVAVGALGFGWLVQALVKLSLAVTVPRWPLQAVRLLGGAATGLLVYLCLFSGSGTGWFNGTGWFPGGGPGGATGGKDGSTASSKEGKKTEIAKTASDHKEEKKEKEKEKPPVQPGETLRIEVLGNDTLQKIAKTGAFDKKKLYRIVGDTRLLTLEDVEELIVRRLAETPPLRRLDLYIYLDSPNEDKAQVTDLTAWMNDDPKRRTVKVNTRLQGDKAPVD